MKITHLADTHIRNYKYHREYRAVFDKIYERLREEQPDCIVHCGDLAHTKTQLSPEYFDLATSFLKNLADIAPVYIILGNHDGNLKNASRQDAITPIATALNHPDLHLIKNAGEVSVSDKITFNVLSVFDEDNWVKPSNPDKINIALYHGSVSGVVTDTGWVMTHGDHPIEIFADFDYALLGDIHKTNQIIDGDTGKVRYPGSTVQQNFAETNDKGFLLWNIESKEDFTCEHIAIENPRPFITIELTPKGRMPSKTKVPKGARLRLVSKNNLSLDVMKKAVDVAKQRFKPESIVFLNRAAGERGNVEEITDGLKKEDLRDPAIQEELIREYLKDYQTEDSLMKEVLDLNLKYTKAAEESEEVSRNVKWRVDSLEWDNLFNYGEGNRIDFEKLEGTVGLFGKNFSGKSSAVDSLLFTLFNSTSKNERKNVNVINQNKKDASGTATLSIGSNKYFIERASEKYTRRLKGVESIEAKTNLDFYKLDAATGERIELNGLTRNDTDKNIRKIFGTLDDFLLTSMSSQLDSMQFIREGSTRRKEILAKFLDLEIFEKKFKLAKEDASDMKGALRRMEGKDFLSEINVAETELAEALEELETQQALCENYGEEIEASSLMLQELIKKIESIPAEIIDIVKVRKDIKDKQAQIDGLNSQNEKALETIEENKTFITKAESFLATIDIEELRGKQEEIKDIDDSIKGKTTEEDNKEREIESKEEQVKTLDDIPCGTKHQTCKFIKDAYASKAQIPKDKEALEEIIAEIKALQDKLEELNPAEVEDLIAKHQQVSDKRDEAEKNNSSLKLLIANNNSLILSTETEVKDLTEKADEYEENKEAIENLEGLTAQKKGVEREIKVATDKMLECEKEVVRLNRSVGSLEQKVANAVAQRDEYLDLQKQFSAYDLYMRCMHPNGIAYDVIKRKLPVINESISKVLANLTSFEVMFDENGKKLDINIKHPAFDPRPLEMASGSEKTMAAMAIRLALLSVSSLPTSDIMILDEPGTALDEDHLQAFTEMLDMIKSYFKTVLLISHLDSLKDVVDTTIDISQANGCAFVNQ